MLRSCVLDKRKTRFVSKAYYNFKPFSTKLPIKDGYRKAKAISIESVMNNRQSIYKNPILSWFERYNITNRAMTYFSGNFPHIFQERKPPKGK